jgi:hypothetical protein
VPRLAVMGLGLPLSLLTSPRTRNLLHADENVYPLIVAKPGKVAVATERFPFPAKVILARSRRDRDNRRERAHVDATRSRRLQAPSNAREIKMRWTSLVPSPISSTFASR